MCAGKATLRIAALPRLTSQAHPYTQHPTLYNNSADLSLYLVCLLVSISSMAADSKTFAVWKVPMRHGPANRGDERRLTAS